MKRTRYGKHDIAAEWGRRYLSRRAEVDLELVELEDSSFHLIVPVEIDGVRGDMIVDTGASVTVVERKLFPVPLGPTRAKTFIPLISLYIVCVKSIYYLIIRLVYNPCKHFFAKIIFDFLGKIIRNLCGQKFRKIKVFTFFRWKTHHP